MYKKNCQFSGPFNMHFTIYEIYLMYPSCSFMHPDSELLLQVIINSNTPQQGKGENS
jgi:hypothetical protein